MYNLNDEIFKGVQNNMYKRVLLKLSGEALSGNGQPFDPEVLKSLAAELKMFMSLVSILQSLLVEVTSFVAR